MTRIKKRRSVCNTLKRTVQGCTTTFAKQILSFCNETGLHGCKYIYEKQRPMVERIAWAIIVLASVCIAIAMLKITYDYYDKHNVLSVIESTHHGIWHYPFPAVTICDFNRVSLGLTKRLVENLTLPSTEWKEFIVQEMKLLDELLYPGRRGSHVRNNLSRLQNIFDMNELSIPTVIKSVTRSCEDLLESCRWKAKEVDCNAIFQPSLTRDGICCSFNYVTYDRIIEQPNLKIHKMTSCGYQSGLNVLLNLDPDDYHASMLDTVGVKVMLHDPYNYPDFDAASRTIGLNDFTFLTVEPVETYSTSSIRAMSDRMCMYEDEVDVINGDKSKKDFMFARYSYINCLAECRAATIRMKCGCIPYYYLQNRTRVCNLRDIECLEAFRFWYETAWPGSDLSPKTLPPPELNSEQRPCGCKIDCNFYQYFMESSAGRLDKRVYHNGLTYTNNPSKGESWRNQSIIHIFFGDLVSLQFRRDIRYSWRHLFATFGGLLGVFAGFSFMSLFEIVYFFVIRVIVDACTRGKNSSVKA